MWQKSKFNEFRNANSVQIFKRKIPPDGDITLCWVKV